MQQTTTWGKPQRTALAAAVLVSLLGAAPMAQAGSSYTFNENPLSGPSDLGYFNIANGINNSGVIVGNYASTSNTNPGFVGNTSITYGVDGNGSRLVNVLGINSAGDIVGTYQGALGAGSIFYATPSAYSATTPTLALGLDTNTHGNSVNGETVGGITDTGLIVGTNILANGAQYIYEYNIAGNTFTDLSLPISATILGGIKVTGVSSDGTYITGNYGAYGTDGYVYDTVTNVFTTISPTAGSSIFAEGVNKYGEVVGYTQDKTTGDSAGFIFSAVTAGFVSTQIIDTSYDVYTTFNGVNDKGVIIGNNGYDYVIFTATPNASAVPLPGAAWLMGSGLLLGLRLLKRKV